MNENKSKQWLSLQDSIMIVREEIENKEIKQYAFYNTINIKDQVRFGDLNNWKMC